MTGKRAENELLRTELKVDALRYQWLKKHAEHIYGMWFFNGLSSTTGPTEFEAAVDYAMQKEETE